MRGLEFDPARETVMEGMRRRRESRGECRRYEEGTRQGEETRREERRGPKGREEREGWTGWFAGSLLLIFPVRLAASSFRSWSSSSCPPTAPSIALLIPSFPSRHRLRPAHPAPADSSVPTILALLLPLYPLAR